MAKALIPLLLVLTISQVNFLLGNVVSPREKNSNELDYRLPGEAVPLHYELHLEPDLASTSFAGSVKIKIEAHNNTSTLTLNAKNLTVLQSNVQLRLLENDKPAKEILTKSIDMKPEQEFLIIEFQENLVKDKQYILTVKYTGKLNDQMRGFYMSRYFDKDNKIKYVAVTHFEPTGARLAFPCWDEPAYKAPFKISITHLKSYTAISNMPEINNVPVNGDKVTTTFEETNRMSTYLVAFLVSDYGYTANTDKTFRVWTKPHAVNQAAYALEMGEKLLKELSSYTGIAYDTYIKKMDQVSLKDFAPSAMENWGLVTYRESALLYEVNVTTLRSKQSITTIIAHEFAHQWFGNLVSPKWWTYIWLNEGFANYFQYFITHKLLPEWRLNEIFVVENMQGNAFVADQAEKVRPMNKEANSPQEISSLFDSIAYQKAGSVIRMMSHILTEDVFQKGLTRYLNSSKLSVAESSDLFNSLQETAGKKWENKTIGEIMDAWVNKPGYPVVSVVRNKDGNLEISQKRFTLYGSEDDTKWWVPLTYTVQSQKEEFFAQTNPVKWLSPTKTNEIINNVKKDEWIILNNQQTGYYRVNYDNENWKLLADYLNSDKFTKVHIINRAQLIDDSLNMARANHLNYTVALPLTLYLHKETGYAPWEPAFRNLNFLNTMLRTSEHYDLFKLYMRYILKEVTNKVEYKPKKEDEDITTLLRTNAMKWACKVDVNECKTYAEEQFKAWLDNSNTPLNVDLKQYILCAGLRSADEAAWNKTYQELTSAKEADEDGVKSLYPVLACSDSPTILKNYLLLTCVNNSRVPFGTAVKGVVSEHPEGVDIALDMMESNYEQIKQLNNFESVWKSCVEAVGNAVTTQKQFVKLSTLMVTGVQAEVLQTTTRKVLQNIKWVQLHQETIENWLVTNEPTFSSASSLAFASFLVILSIFITRFY